MAALEQAVTDILAANIQQGRRRRTFTHEKKAEIGQYAIINGNAAAVARFDINESTIRGTCIKRRYEAAQAMTSADDTTTPLQALSDMKRGRKLLLGEEMDMEVQEFIRGQRERGAVINKATTVAIGKAVVMRHNRRALVEYGGHIDITKHWAESILHRMKYVKRRGSTKVRVPDNEFQSLKTTFLSDIRATALMEEIPDSLIINWDQTAISIVPGSTWTMAPSGSRRIEIAGMGDKRQITAVFAGTLDGRFLPQQLIYSGKTSACHPQVEFPADWHITHTANHWANESTMKDYLNKIIIPYVKKTIHEDNLPQNQKALVIFDVFRGQMCQSIIDILVDNGIHFVRVPPNCTDRLQPLDLAVNKSCKDFIKTKFIEWYSTKVLDSMNSGEETAEVSLRLSVMKPLSAKWLMEFEDYMKSHPAIMKNGFIAAGIDVHV